MFRKRTKKVGAKNNLRRKRAINENAIDGGDNNNYNEEEDDDDDEQNDNTQIGLSIRKTMKKQKILASMPMTTPDFIEKQIATNNDTIANARPKGNAEEDLSTKDEDNNNNNNSNNSEEGLYKQLAREVTNTGETGGGGGGGDNNNNNSDNMVDSRNDADEDQGALLVGTGIAEVILPTTSHRPVASSTSMGYVRNTNNLFLSSAVPEDQRHKHKMPDTTPKPFDNAHDNVNNTRQGFDAFRGKETPSSSSDNNNNRDNNNNNNRGKRTGKSRDDQAYGHFMKTAIAGRKMR
ncbi:hypothetical protein FRACYDRAFT_234278 [Fragilariopsis cylindrus CCMP1102]|uniref:Uncharacterized protein n=1 Tax=Fragilariopsis cylindrus CCMP1102 TaxID=635003 RepID=A0A1E7FR69_9STRA|nr:hypothetical protein FRACYDRAFT_234278 [Fragilariopsis cylindrus CCMP1102]|eukprot:OEU20646.1 hypothetical protein FRACYDRAFT_234278 [Fragilariopsis cylindrus CCMP1102]